MKENELYEAFGELFHCNDMGESDSGVDTVVDALFATHTVAELSDMYDKLKSHVDALEAPVSDKTPRKTTITLLNGELTTKDLETLQPGTVIAHGTVPNSPESDGIYMTTNNVGKMLMWAAIMGHAHDWTVYIHWAENGIEHVKSNGDKIANMDNVKMLVPCSDEALKHYRL